MYKEHIGMISKTDLFQNIKVADIPKVLDYLKPTVKSYKRNDHIVNQGDNFESIGILLKSEGKIYKENLAGNAIMVKILKPRDIFGEAIVFSSQGKWPITIQAQGDCQILFISKEKILQEDDITHSWHKIMIANILRILSERALYLNRRLEYLSIKSTRGKISSYLFEQYKKVNDPNFELDLNRNELADFLNISRPTLSREMCRMRDEGIIEFHLKTVHIIDVQELKKLVSL